LRLVEASKVDGYWRLKVELTREEASLISTVFGVDVCSTEYVNVDELVRRLLHSIMVNQLRESKSGCTVAMLVGSVWLQNIIPAGGLVGEERQLVDFLVKGLELVFNSMLPLARSLEELRRSVAAPCIDPLVSTRLNDVLEELPLLCVKGRRIGRSHVLEVVAGDAAIPSYSLRLQLDINVLPDILVETWFRGRQSRITGCIRVEDRDVIIGTTRFKTGFFYVNDCLVLEGYIANCREQSRGRVVKMVEVEELGLDERGRRVVSSFLAMMGGENVEMFESNEWFYIKGLSARNPIREAELCLRRRFTRI
jgi:hypothetical protein